MSKAVHTLALGVQYLPEIAVACNEKAAELLRVFFQDPTTK